VLATDRLVAWTAGGLYTTAGVLALLPTVVPQPSEVDVVTLRWLGAAALAIGLLVFAVGRALPRTSFHVLLVGGNALVTAAVLCTSGNELSVAYAGLYLFVALYGALFFAWRSAAVHLAAVVLACASALGPPTRGAAVLVAGTTVVVAVVVAWLVRAASAAEVDPLTGLLNRRGFDRVMGSAVSRAERGGAPLALAFLDLDHFKLVNDRGGHSRGDELLRSTARALGVDRLPGQAVSRHGGDEFALLLPGLDTAGATAVVEQLRERLVPGSNFSAGVAAWQPGDSESMLCHRADMALYMAKRSGRGRTSSYSDATEADDPTELHASIQAGEVFVHYQPVVDLHTGLLVGAEALARWQHPVRGTVSPIEFVPAAERSGAVHALGAAVLADACVRAVGWLADIPGFGSVSVNASPRELEHDDYVDGVLRLLRRTGLPPDALVLEVTESALDEGAARITAALHRLRAFGVRVAMDDFGTGYSSLSRLDSLPVDIIKIDRAFVSPIGPTTVAAPIVAATVAMAGALGLTVIVEGVETPHQADVLRRHGCSRAQGYLFSAPVPPERLPTALSEGVVAVPRSRRPMADSAGIHR
jgi:diguanylate cyclase (GGDEF)-like protein